jgi:hypothetical protein
MDWLLFLYGWCSLFGLVAAGVVALIVVLIVADQVTLHPDALGFITRWLDEHLFGVENDSSPWRTLLLIAAVVLGEVFVAMWLAWPLGWLASWSWWSGAFVGQLSLAALVLFVFAVDRYRSRRGRGKGGLR